MSWANAGWWMLYAFVGIAMQAAFPGLDFLLPGFILLLQERRLFQTLLVGTLFLLAQEGMGSMAFGGTLLWYGFTAIAFHIACGLFQGGSFLFVFLLGGVLSAAHGVIFGMLASLQDIPWEAASLLDECLLQAMLTPCVWWAASSLRKGVTHEAR